MVESTADFKDLNVLIVEDEHLQRMVLSVLLKKMGICHIEEAADGESALTLINKNVSSLDLLICDLNIPGKDGRELIRYLGENNIKIAVILASASDPAVLHSIETMAQEQGVRFLGMIDKPISIPKLEPLIQKLF